MTVLPTDEIHTKTGKRIELLMPTGTRWWLCSSTYLRAVSFCSLLSSVCDASFLMSSTRMFPSVRRRCGENVRKIGAGKVNCDQLVYRRQGWTSIFRKIADKLLDTFLLSHGVFEIVCSSCDLFRSYFAITIPATRLAYYWRAKEKSNISAIQSCFLISVIYCSRKIRSCITSCHKRMAE
jgi:hypothetical protein